MGPHLTDRPFEDGHRGPQELVNRRSNHDDHNVGSTQHCCVGTELEPASGQEFGEQLIGAGLHEGHLPGDPPQSLLVGVVHADSQTRSREHQAEWKTHVPAAAKHDEIEIGGAGRR